MSLFFLAIAAGFLTILAPCILPVLPFLLGSGAGRSRMRPVAIVGGFVVSFSLFGAALATAGTVFGISGEAFRTIAASLLLLFGAAMLFESAYLRLTAGVQSLLTSLGTKVAGNANMKSDAWSGVAVGVSLGLIWTPCAGPILGTIITLASRTADFLTTLLLMFAYALGAGIPMLGVAYGGHVLQERLRAAGKAEHVLRKVFGVLIVVMAVLILTGKDLAVQTWLIQFYPATFTTKL